MSKLLIFGAGGHGKVVAETAQASGRWEEVAFLDDKLPFGTEVLEFSIVGAFSDAKVLHETYGEALVAVGDSKVRLKLLDQLSKAGYALPTLVHSSAVVSSSASLDEGCVVFAQAAINAEAQIGRGCIVNTGATVDHDCVLGDGVHVCPGASLGGDVHVGNGSWLGIGCSVIQGIRIGECVTLGAGAAVISDIEGGLTVVGVPARGISGGLE